MRTVKPEVRILGVDDAAFEFEDDTTELIGVVYRGGKELEGVIKRDITIDGFDVTETVLDMVLESRHRDQIQVVVLDGITFGGFNIVDIHRLAADGDVGVIAVSRNKPDIDRMRNGLQHVSDTDTRIQTIKDTGEAQEYETGQGTIYFQYAGMDEEQAREAIGISRNRSMIPEPVRVAHLIAGALKNGESKSRV